MPRQNNRGATWQHARIYLEPGSELCDEPHDFVVLDIVVSVLDQISP